MEKQNTVMVDGIKMDGIYREPAKYALVVGLSCTYGIGGDRTAGRVVEVSKSGRIIKVEFSNYGNPTQELFTRRADGRYKPAGSKCGYLTFGIAEDYRDPHF